MGDFSHIDDSGEAQMVDVGGKDVTRRRAVARGWVYMSTETLEAIEADAVEKGDVRQVSRIAGIMGAKRTEDLIPLCHQIPLENVSVRFETNREEGALEVVAEATCSAKTGAEMEAMTAVSTAALTIYDMCKGVDRAMSIGDVHLVRKTGGSSGDFRHPEPPGPEPKTDPDGEE